MALTNLASIRGLARIRADQTNSTFPTDTECNTLIDTVAKRVWRKLYKAGWKPVIETTSITATGAARYFIGSHILAILDVMRVDGGSRYPLTRLKPEERAEYISAGAGTAEKYDLVGGVNDAMGVNTQYQQLVLYPNPANGTYEVYQVIGFDGFNNDDAAVWEGPPGSDELIALEAAVMMLGKEGDVDMMRLLKDEAAELYAEICETAGWIDEKYVPTVRDVMRNRNQVNGFSWRATDADMVGF